MSDIDARFTGRFGGFSLDAAFTCPGRGVTGIFGPSGCGKTTILRCIAGLTRVAKGYLRVDGEIWQDEKTFIAPHKRPVGYVFQDARLFSHLPVQGNLGYGLRRALDQSPRISFDAVVDLLGIGNLLSRAVTSLSGGERQRVAIGRALLSQPRVLLMDEPLSALDRDSKQDILPYLENLASALSLPVLYVSHDLAEIERLSDRLVLVAKDGRVQACGHIEALSTDLSLPLSRRPDSAAVISVAVEHYDAAYDMTLGRVDGLPFFAPGHLGTPGAWRRIHIRASDVSLVKTAPEGTSVLNILPARILSVEMVSLHKTLVLLALSGRSGEVRLLSSVTRQSWDGLNLAPGDTIFAQVKGMAIADDASRNP